MKAIAVFILFLGTILIMQGYYSDKSKQCPTPKEIVKYVPLSVYEDQLSGEENLQKMFKSMFEDITPWPTVRG